eukprot:12536680-Alexandrium_andersonii.AAC.1
MSWSGLSGRRAANGLPWPSWRLGGWRWPASSCRSCRTLPGARRALPLPLPFRASRRSRP